MCGQFCAILYLFCVYSFSLENKLFRHSSYAATCACELWLNYTGFVSLRFSYCIEID